MTYFNGSKRRRDVTVAQGGSGERGQSLLEFALMLPFLLLLAVAVAELGRAVYYTVAVNNGATAGAEFGSQTSITAANKTGIINSAMCDANGGSPPSCKTGILTSSNITVVNGCTCDDSGAGVSCDPMPAQGTCASVSCTNAVVECVQVSTTANFSPMFHYPGVPGSFTANGNAVMRVRK
jgi:Flp pilus assembly protein TadG